MKNSLVVFSAFFCFLFFGVTISYTQNVGDKKSQTEIFGNQPIWTTLTSQDTFNILLVSDEVSCSPGDKILFWNAIDHGQAQLQLFNPGDSIIVMNYKGTRFYYKIGCHNRLRFVRVQKTVTATPTTVPTVTFAPPCNPPNPCDDATCDQLVVATWCLDAGKGCFTDVCGFKHKAKTWKIDYYFNRLPSGWIIDNCGRQFFIHPEIPACPCDKWQTGKYNY